MSKPSFVRPVHEIIQEEVGMRGWDILRPFTMRRSDQIVTGKGGPITPHEAKVIEHAFGWPRGVVLSLQHIGRMWDE